MDYGAVSASLVQKRSVVSALTTSEEEERKMMIRSQTVVVVDITTRWRLLLLMGRQPWSSAYVARILYVNRYANVRRRKERKTHSKKKFLNDENTPPRVSNETRSRLTLPCR